MTAAVLPRPWRQALPALLLALAWILYSYGETLMAMVGIWWRSETFNHAFLVPIISLWLIWRQRRTLALLTPRPAPSALFLVALAGFGWLLGELASVNAVTQLALVSLLVLSVPALLGWRLALVMAFPLGYLFFAVPIGEFVMPWFMEWTADFTVGALQLTGIPVYREGLQFVIPSGRWSVVEACSGVRYLIASLVVGTLYAYLNYRSLRRRLIFVGVSLLVPIVANWLRAYLIVMIGHLSDNRLAAGVDHLIYGWVFFGVVILLMFWVGGRWADNPGPEAMSGGIAEQPPPAAASRFWLLALLLGGLVWLPLGAIGLLHSGDREGIPVMAITVPGWADQAPQQDWRPAFDGAVTEVRREYHRDGHWVGLFVGYYRRQDFEHKLVASTNTLVRSEDKLWARVSVGSRELEVAGQPVSAATAELKGADGSRLLVRHWYWINGRLTASSHLAKAYTALSRLTGQGDDSAVVVLYAPKAEGRGEADLDAFLADAGAGIESALDQARRQP